MEWGVMGSIHTAADGEDEDDETDEDVDFVKGHGG